MVEQGGVARCLGMVELVDDDDVEVAGVDRLDRADLERLDHREYVLARFRPASTAEDLTERGILQHRAKRGAALVEDLVTVGDEQQSERAPGAANEGCVVKRRHDRLPGAGRRNDQVAVSTVPVALHHQVLEHSTLVWMRDHVESSERVAVGVAPSATLAPECVLEAVEIAVRCELLECVVAPVGVERRPHPLNDRRRFGLGQPHVPLKPGMHRRSREIRRPDKRRRKPVRSVKQPRLRMELRSLCVECDPHTRAELAQCLDRFRLSRSRVRRCDDADRSAASDDISKRVEQSDDAAPDHECADQVDARRALKLSLKLRADRRLLPVVDEQLVRRQWDLWAIR